MSVAGLALMGRSPKETDRRPGNASRPLEGYVLEGYVLDGYVVGWPVPKDLSRPIRTIRQR